MPAFRFEPCAITPAAKAMRARIRAFLADTRASGLWRPGDDFTRGFSPDFSRALGRAGFLGLTWPAEYGGQGRSVLERWVVTEELIVAGAPVGAHWVADRQSGPQILRHGTDAQKRRYLPGIAAGECWFAIGMSEPGAGSDLAAVRTKAVRTADGWRLAGRKIWTTWAHRCHHAIVLARTGSVDAADRHAGLTQFVVDLRAPGVEIRPVPNMAGSHEFNEILFDDVALPPDALLGQEGRGWAQLAGELAHERGGPERFLSSVRLLLEMARLAGPDPDPRVAEALGRFAARLATLRRMSMSVAAMLDADRPPALEAAMVKDLGNRFERAVPDEALRLRELLPATDERAAALDALLEECLLTAPSWSLRGGTREILKGIVARGLEAAA